MIGGLISLISPASRRRCCSSWLLGSVFLLFILPPAMHSSGGCIITHGRGRRRAGRFRSWLLYRVRPEVCSHGGSDQVILASEMPAEHSGTHGAFQIFG